MKHAVLKSLHGIYGGIVKDGIGTEYDCVLMMTRVSNWGRHRVKQNGL